MVEDKSKPNKDFVHSGKLWLGLVVLWLGLGAMGSGLLAGIYVWICLLVTAVALWLRWRKSKKANKKKM